jgi:hypothetical protein
VSLILRKWSNVRSLKNNTTCTAQTAHSPWPVLTVLAGVGPKTVCHLLPPDLVVRELAQLSVYECE